MSPPPAEQPSPPRPWQQEVSSDDTSRQHPQARVWIGGHDLRARRAAEHHFSGCTRPATGPLDIACITPETVDEAVYFAQKTLDRLAPEGVVWIALTPKQCSSSFAAALHALDLIPTGQTPLADDVKLIRFTRIGA